MNRALLLIFMGLTACAAVRRPLVEPSREAPTVMVLSLRMPGLFHHVGRHAWIAARAPGDPEWTYWECCPPYSHSSDTPFRPSFGDDPWLHAVFQGEEAKRMISCLPGATLKYGDPPYWVWPGPNSNTYVDYVLRECGIHVDLPPTCVGKDFRGLLGASFTSGGTGFQIESPLLGLRLGLTEGIELHLFAVSFGIDFWRPALIVPFEDGRVGFADW